MVGPTGCAGSRTSGPPRSRTTISCWFSGGFRNDIAITANGRHGPGRRQTILRRPRAGQDSGAWSARAPGASVSVQLASRSRARFDADPASAVYTNRVVSGSPGSASVS